MIGLSGLITPSLEEMVHVAMELEKVGLIRRKKQGLGRPAKIYVADISALSA